MGNGLNGFVSFLLSIGFEMKDSETGITLKQLPVNWSVYGRTKIFFKKDDRVIEYGVTEGIVLGKFATFRHPLPFRHSGVHYRDADIMQVVVKEYTFKEVYEAMFGEKLQIDIWDKKYSNHY